MARKVNEFLVGGAPVTSVRRQHGASMESWLANLEAQISASMTSVLKPELPKAALIRLWAEELADEAVDAVAHDMRGMGSLTHKTAIRVQQAIVVGLVVGTAFPPLRLDLIKTLNHPDTTAAYGCTDPDCQEGDSCLGNRIEIFTKPPPAPAADEGSSSAAAGAAAAPSTWHFGYGSRAVRLHIVHGKNDRRACRANYQINFDVPDGSLHRLLLAHITEGHGIMVIEKPDDEPIRRLFLSNSKLPFNDVTFVHYWKAAMSSAKEYGLPYFPPSAARTVFVEDYTSANGMEPENWDGAAAVMGNRVEQWRANYWPSRKRRAVQDAVAGHARFAAGGGTPGVPRM